MTGKVLNRKNDEREETFADLVERGELVLPPKNAGTDVPSGGRSPVATQNRSESRKRLQTFPLPPDDEHDESFMDKAEYAANGTDKRLIKKLLREYPEAKLDLHGLTSAEAHEQLNSFLHQQLLAGHRHVHIIHGKGEHSVNGRAVLKIKARKWLVSCPGVLGYVTAPDGGSLHAWLRRL